MMFQVASALAQPSALNVVSRLTMDWCTTRERDAATTAASMANVLGQMLFSWLPAHLVRSPEQLSRILGVQVAPAALVFAAVFCWLPERPATPPSAGAAAQWREREAAAQLSRGRSGTAALQQLAGDCRRALAIPAFALLTASFALGTAVVWTLLVLQAQLVAPCGYGDRLAGSAGSLMVGCGVLSALAVGAYMEAATKRYLALQRGVPAAGLLALLILGAALRPGRPGVVLAAFAVNGVAQQPLMPVSLEHAAEVTFPLGADVSASVLFVAANYAAAALVALVTPLLNRDSGGGAPRQQSAAEEASCSAAVMPTLAVLAAFQAAALALAVVMKADYRRGGAEQRAAGGGAGDEGGGGVAAPLLGEGGGGGAEPAAAQGHGGAAERRDE